MGDDEDGCFSSFCMEELVGETLFKYLEYGTGLSNVVIPQECNTCTFEDIERPLDLLMSMLVGTLFE